MKRIRLWLIGILAVVLLGCALYVGIRIGRGPGDNKKVQLSQAVLEDRLEAVGELVTVKYYYTDMGKYDSSKLIGEVKIPFTTTSFIITFDGVISAGVDLKEAEIAMQGKEVTVALPRGRILSNEIKEDSTVVYDEKNSIFNGLSVADVTNFQSEQKKQMEEKAVANGLIDEAEEKAQSLLKSLWDSLMSGGEFEEGYTLHVNFKSEG